MKAPCTSPPRPAPANPPSAAGRPCRAFPAPRRPIRSRRRRSTRSRCRKSLRTRLPLLVPLRDFGKDMDCGRGRRTWHRSDLEQALAAWVDRSPPPGLNGALLKAHLAAGSAFLLLDGLDEVAVSESRNGATVYPRQLLLSGLADALPAWEKAGNRTLLTSRPYGLDEAGLARLGLPRAPLEPLPEPLQELFVIRWFHTLKREELAERLLEAMRGRDDLAPLSRKPDAADRDVRPLRQGPPPARGPLRALQEHRRRRAAQPVSRRRPRAGAGPRRLEAIAYGMHTGEPDEAPRQTPAAEISWDRDRTPARPFRGEEPRLRARRGRRGGPARGAPDPLRPAAAAAERAGRLLSPELSGVPRGAAHRARQRKTGDRGHRCPRGRLRVAPDACCFCSPLSSSTRTPSGGSTCSGGCSKARTAPRSRPTRRRRCSSPRRSSCAWPSAIRFPRLWPRASAGSAWTPSRTRSRCRPGRRSACAWVGWATRASSTCAIPAPMSRCRPGPIPMARRARRSRSRRRSCIGRYPVTNSQYRAFLEDGGYSDRKWWSDAGWDWLQKARRSPSLAIGVTGAGTAPTSRWSASASGRRRPAAPGRAGACRGSRNGRPPPAARTAVSTPGATTGRTASATPTRPAWA